MTPNTSIEAPSRNSEHLVELEEEQLRNAHLVEFREALHRSWQTSFKAGSGAHGIETEQRSEGQQAPSRIEELNRDSFLRFRDEWVRNRGREIQQAGSISFRTCSEDTASITALNEFYRWRVFDAFKAEHRDVNDVEIGMIHVSRDLGTLRKDVSPTERPHMCRIICREKGRRDYRKTCRRREKVRL